ncbi:acrB/AcrD/AcrF family protein, partial [Vibrio parahaemolyticus V-223/04]
VCKHVS